MHACIHICDRYRCIEYLYLSCDEKNTKINKIKDAIHYYPRFMCKKNRNALRVKYSCSMNGPFPPNDQSSQNPLKCLPFITLPRTLQYDTISPPTSHPPPPTPHPTPSHPQTQLPTRRPARDPIPLGMKLRHGRHSRDTLAAQLRHLLALGGVDVDEAVHIADAEALRGGERVRGEVPLGAEAGVEGVG